MASLNLPFGLRVLNGLPVDNKYYNLSDTPYTNTSQVITQIPTGARYAGLTVVVGTGVSAKEYWWKLTGGVTDIELIEKTDSATLAGTGSGQGASLVGFQQGSTGLGSTVQSAIINLNSKVNNNTPTGTLLFVDDPTDATYINTLAGWTEVTVNFQSQDPNGNDKGLYLKIANIYDPETAGAIGGNFVISQNMLPAGDITLASLNGTIAGGDHTHAHNLSLAITAYEASGFGQRLASTVSPNNGLGILPEYLPVISGGVTTAGHSHTITFSNIKLNSAAIASSVTPKYKALRVFKRNSFNNI